MQAFFYFQIKMWISLKVKNSVQIDLKLNYIVMYFMLNATAYLAYYRRLLQERYLDFPYSKIVLLYYRWTTV